MTDTSDKALLALSDRLDALERVSDILTTASEAAATLRAIVAERQDKPAAGDVIETLARGLNQEYVLALTTIDVNTFVLAQGFTERATALHAQIAPALRAEGMEMAAGIATGFLVGDPMDGIPLRDPTSGEIAATILAKAKRLREGGEG
jgi:hypothetical protein